MSSIVLHNSIFTFSSGNSAMAWSVYFHLSSTRCCKLLSQFLILCSLTHFLCFFQRKIEAATSREHKGGLLVYTRFLLVVHFMCVGMHLVCDVTLEKSNLNENENVCCVFVPCPGEEMCEK